MAGHLNWTRAILILLAAPSALAQGLSDPMRPPREISGRDADPAEVGLSPAQVIVISRDRTQATINGQTVPLGGRYGNATLVRITDEEIVLRRAETTEVIRLYSSVNRRMRVSAGRTATKAAEGRKDGNDETN